MFQTVGGTWPMRLDIFAHATGCTVRTIGKKRMLLLHTAGEEVQGIFATVADTEATYDEAVAALDYAHSFCRKRTLLFRDVFSAAIVRKLTKQFRSSWPNSEN